MKKILVLTDFSQNSINAYNYAVQMACQLKADILLLFSTNGAPLSLTNQLQYSQQLHSFAKRYACDSRRKQNPHHTECLISGDHWATLLPTMAAVHTPDIIISGSGLLGAIEHQGNSLPLDDLAACPILWIPEKATYQPLKEVVFVTDFTDQNPTVINLVKTLSQNFEAKVAAVHFYGSARKDNMAEIKKLGGQLAWVLNHGATYHMVEEEDMMEGMQEFSERHPVDAFFLATRDTHLTRQYLDQAFLKTGACQLNTPLLSLYQPKTKPCTGSCTHCQLQKEEAALSKDV